MLIKNNGYLCIEGQGVHNFKLFPQAWEEVDVTVLDNGYSLIIKFTEGLETVYKSANVTFFRVYNKR